MARGLVSYFHAILLVSQTLGNTCHSSFSIFLICSRTRFVRSFIRDKCFIAAGYLLVWYLLKPIVYLSIGEQWFFVFLHPSTPQNCKWVFSIAELSQDLKSDLTKAPQNFTVVG